MLMAVCRSAGGWFWTLGLCSLGLVVVRAMWLLFYLVVCRSAGGWFARLGCAPWVSLW